MSTTDSPRRTSRPVGLTLRPESVTEKSFMESMAGFIHEVVPQAYGGCQTGEAVDPILWAKMEQIEGIDCLSQSSGCHKTNLPLLLVLGYASGIQLWTVLASGEAQEILSLNQGSIKVFAVVPNPSTNGTEEDIYASKRPLVAVCENSGPNAQLHPVTFLSLRTGEQVKTIRFKNPVVDIMANRRVVVVTFPEKVAVFSSCSLEDQIVLTHCYLSPTLCSNPVALGSRWLAYAEKRLVSLHRCSGGFEGEGIQSYTATVIHAAKSLTKGLREFGETFASSLTGQRSLTAAAGANVQGPQPGVVTIIDLDGVAKGQVNIREDVDGVVAHFVAHANQAISFLAFDPSGSLLLTADRQGHNFHIFRVHPAPCGTKQSAVHHLYTLYRGDTTCKVQDVAFTNDSRWVAVTTLRGTTHVFPISPYGGSVGVRTHTSQRVVNRLSRFHRSAGLDDAPSSGRSSPVPASTPANEKRPSAYESAPLFPFPNPRLPPYPHPIVVSPLVQLRSTLAPANPTGFNNNPRSGSRHSSGGGEEAMMMRVTCCFAPPRGFTTGALNSLGAHNVGAAARDRLSRRTAESLYVMSCHGTLVEYGLEPRIAAGIAREKASDKSAIDVDVVPCAQWFLHRPAQSLDLAPPLPANVLALITTGPQSSTEMEKNDESPTSSSSSYPPLITASDVQDTWLAQVEINTHAGPHRRLWMGPQFTFKTLKRDSSTSSLAEIEASEIDILSRPARSNPVNMPETIDIPIQGLPIITGEGSASSYEQSPRFLAAYGRERYSTQRCDSESSISDLVPKVEVELQLKENLADAMMEMPSGGTQIPEEEANERRRHYFMEEERMNWPQTSLSSNHAMNSDTNEEDLLDFELENESCPSRHPVSHISSSKYLGKIRHSSKEEATTNNDKDYSFFANGEVISGLSVDVAFFPDARSAGESSSTEEDVVVDASSCDDRTERKSKKNRKKKK